MDKKKEEAYREKPEHLKDVFEFDRNNMKDEPDNKDITGDAKGKNKKKDDDLMDRFAGFADGLI